MVYGNHNKHTNHRVTHKQTVHKVTHRQCIKSHTNRQCIKSHIDYVATNGYAYQLQHNYQLATLNPLGTHTWLDTQMVILGFCPCCLTTGMSTVSTVPPAASPPTSENTSFLTRTTRGSGGVACFGAYLVPSAAVAVCSSRSPPSTVICKLKRSLGV